MANLPLFYGFDMGYWLSFQTYTFHKVQVPYDL